MPTLNRDQFKVETMGTPEKGFSAIATPHSEFEEIEQKRQAGTLKSWEEIPVASARLSTDPTMARGVHHVGEVQTRPEHQRMGLASHLWDVLSERMKGEGVELQHSEERTAQGDAFAKAVGGHVPPLSDSRGRPKPLNWTPDIQHMIRESMEFREARELKVDPTPAADWGKKGEELVARARTHRDHPPRQSAQQQAVA